MLESSEAKGRGLIVAVGSTNSSVAGSPKEGVLVYRPLKT